MNKSVPSEFISAPILSILKEKNSILVYFDMLWWRKYLLYPFLHIKTKMVAIIIYFWKIIHIWMWNQIKYRKFQPFIVKQSYNDNIKLFKI